MIYWFIEGVGEEGHEGIKLTSPLLGLLFGMMSPYL